MRMPTALVLKYLTLGSKISHSLKYLTEIARAQSAEFRVEFVRAQARITALVLKYLTLGSKISNLDCTCSVR
jgi:hypothetical protein